MTVTAGTRLGPYEIVSRIGAGGMGEVWRARDTRLDRSVAVKLLSSEFANNAQLKIRFDREARSISQLNHPHICTLFDVGDERGTSYLVMELLEGETLAERIARGPLPLQDVIRFGTQIADALDRAHQAGIIHRDLKPGNIMITKSGAKLLDFGLAKTTMSPIAGDAPTMQKDLTQEGTIVGTFQYMAPEQLEGTNADARTDIFALGAVLYEMTTGKRAFDGKTRTSLIAAIVAGQPAPIRTMQPLAPSALDHVIATCLQKDPEKRWQSARDVANELAWIAEGASVEATPVSPKGRLLWPIAAAVLAVITVGAIAMLVRARGQASSPPLAFSITAPTGESFSATPAISPDGQFIAFGSREKDGDILWLRKVGTLAPVRLAALPRISHIFWSPDSKFVAFFAPGKLQRISIGGGQPELIARFDGYGVSGAWSRAGDILFSPRFASGLYRVAASGGEAMAVTNLDRRRAETLHGYAKFIDDGDRYVFVRRTFGEAQNQIWAGSLRENWQKPVMKADALVGLVNGWLLFVRNGAIYAQRFDAKNISLSGEAAKIVDDVTYSEDSATALATVSEDGALVYEPSSNFHVNGDFSWYDENGRLLQPIFTERGTRSAELSADDAKMAIMIDDPQKGGADIHVRDLARGIDTRITGGLANNINPIWSADDSRVFFASDREGMYDIYATNDDGVSAPAAIWKGGDDKRPQSASPDGTTLLATLYSPKSKLDLWIVPLNGGRPRPWITTDGNDDGARFSPDGKWVAYVSDRSGRFEMYVVAFPDGRSYQVSTGGTFSGEWSHDGKRILYSDGATNFAVDVARSGNTAVVGKPVTLFKRPAMMNGWGCSRTTNRLLVRTIIDPRETVPVANYVKGWADALK